MGASLRPSSVFSFHVNRKNDKENSDTEYVSASIDTPSASVSVVSKGGGKTKMPIVPDESCKGAIQARHAASPATERVSLIRAMYDDTLFNFGQTAGPTI
jgi:hypothetical protein